MPHISNNPLTIPKIKDSPPVPINGTRGLFAKEDGWYDIDDEGNVKKLGDSGNSSNGLPEVTEEDADKVATVDEFGNWVAKDPLITKDENGRIIIPQANSEFIYSQTIAVGTTLQLWGELFIGSTKQASVPEPTEADEGKFLMVQNGEVAYVDIPSFEGSEF